jgi:SSS family solute:Na+ symporter
LASLHWVDGLIVLAFVVYVMAAGLRSREMAPRNLEEYFLAGRGLSGWTAGLSMAATQFGVERSGLSSWNRT